MTRGPFGINTLTTRRPLTLYVSTVGSDNNTGEVVNSPLKTLAAALDRVPKIVAHDVQIRVIGQHTEALTIADRCLLAGFEIRGNSGNRLTDGVGPVVFDSVQGATNLKTLTVSTPTDGNAVVYQYCGGHNYIDNIISEMAPPPDPIDYNIGGTIDQGRGVMALWGSHVSVYNSRFSGRRYALRASYGGAVLECRNCTGDKNAIGAGARFGGLVTIHGTSPWGFNKTASMSGGIISDEGTIVEGNAPSGGTI